MTKNPTLDRTVHRLERLGHYSYRGVKIYRESGSSFRTLSPFEGSHRAFPTMREMKALIDRLLDGPATL